MKILIDLDPGFLARIEREQVVLERNTGKRAPRTAVMRALMRQALDTNAAVRGEDIPSAMVATPTEPEPSVQSE